MRVVHIVGMGRSGSTLLDRLLASAQGAVSVGELNSLWPALIRGDLCSCGETLASCQRWQNVLSRTQDRVGAFDPETLWATQRRLARDRRPRHWLRARAAEPTSPVHRFVEVSHAVYREVCREAGANTVIDSSKARLRAWLLVQGRPEDSILHLIRDPRPVAHSWARPRKLPEQVRDAFAPALSPWRAAGRWVRNNLAVETTTPFVSRARRLRYEDLCAQPREVLNDLCTWLQLLPPPGQGTVFQCPPSHMIAGNPMRLAGNVVEVKCDERWRRAMPRRNQALVAALTTPLMLAYGYLPSGLGPRPEPRT